MICRKGPDAVGVIDRDPYPSDTAGPKATAYLPRVLQVIERVAILEAGKISGMVMANKLDTE